MKGVNSLRAAITLLAFILLTVHLIWPELKVDSVSVILLIVALLPWVTSIIESAKLPGGWEIKFRDIQAAGNKIANGKLDKNITLIEPSFIQVSEDDPNLALVALRIEIEKRIRSLAEKNDINSNIPLSRLFYKLREKEVLSESVFNGLQEIIVYANQAAHGAKVEPIVADWAISFGPHILGALYNLLKPQLDP
jgi:hypothetical protein